MRLEFHPEAAAEFTAAAELYEAIHAALGGRFAEAVTETCARVLEHPEIGSPRTPRVRRRHVSGFPYDVVYRQHADAIQVVAVAHHSRRPGYWKARASP